MKSSRIQSRLHSSHGNVEPRRHACGTFFVRLRGGTLNRPKSSERSELWYGAGSGVKNLRVVLKSEIHYGFHATPFGTCLLAVMGRHVCALFFLTRSGRKSAVQTLQAQWSNSRLKKDPRTTQPLLNRIFPKEGGKKQHPVSVVVQGTRFQTQVWQALMCIPSGRTVSYQDVAKRIGRPKAMRAVASAIARNPISVIIPCHRVIQKSGHIGNYRWGSYRKQALIGWEAAQRSL